MKLRHVLLALGIVVFLLCGLLFLGFPVVPTSFMGWVALVTLGIPTWFFLEWLGEQVLGSAFFSRRSPAVRILLAVPAVIALVAVGSVLVWVVQWAMLRG